MTITSIEATNQASRAVAKAPRVDLADIEAAILHRVDTTGANVVMATVEAGIEAGPEHPSLDVLSICLLIMRNGFVVVGKSAPAHPDNYNAALGRQFAYEDAVRQLWPLMGFALRDRLSFDKDVDERVRRVVAERTTVGLAERTTVGLAERTTVRLADDGGEMLPE